MKVWNDIMKLKTLIACAVAASVIGGAVQAAGITDTIENSYYFVPTDAQKYDSPYYRSWDQDWEWQHNAIASSFTTASLNISAFDVDYPSERDDIYAKDEGVWVLLGQLTGTSDTWSYGNSFNLGSNFFDEIATGLEVMIDIDVSTRGSWIVTLGKSTLSLDGGGLPPPTPGTGNAVPEPATWAMMIMGFGAMGSVIRRRRASALAA
jgi:hypothetical protein